MQKWRNWRVWDLLKKGFLWIGVEFAARWTKLKVNEQEVEAGQQWTVNASRLIEATRSLAFLRREAKQNNRMMISRSFLCSIAIRGDAELVSRDVEGKEENKNKKQKQMKKPKWNLSSHKQNDTKVSLALSRYLNAIREARLLAKHFIEKTDRCLSEIETVYQNAQKFRDKKICGSFPSQTNENL